MNKIYTLVILFFVSLQVLTSESPYIGKIRLAANDQIVGIFILI